MQIKSILAGAAIALATTAGAASAGDATRAGDAPAVIKAPQVVFFETTADTRPEPIGEGTMRSIVGLGEITRNLVVVGIEAGADTALSSSSGNGSGLFSGGTNATNGARHGILVVDMNPSP